MTDLELTRKCAIKMYGAAVYSTVGDHLYVEPMNSAAVILYAPLHDDAQAMALVKKFGIAIDRHNEGQHLIWMASINISPRSYAEHPDDLNHAIVECVAKMQDAK